MARNRPSDTSIPPTAATWVSSPSSAPTPTATSATAMSAPIPEAEPTRCPSSPPIGLVWLAPSSCAWMEIRLEARKKIGLASFWSPANRKVTPRKRRRGSTYHPAATEPSVPRTPHVHPTRRRSTLRSVRAAPVALTTRLPCPGRYRFPVAGSRHPVRVLHGVRGSDRHRPWANGGPRRPFTPPTRPCATCCGYPDTRHSPSRPPTGSSGSRSCCRPGAACSATSCCRSSCPYSAWPRGSARSCRSRWACWP